MSNVTLIREGAPLLSDIPGMLRKLASDIESGDWGEINSLIVVVPESGDFPHVLQFGDNGGTNEPVLQFELAKMWLINNLVVRA